jgi:hypothetical protein
VGDNDSLVLSAEGVDRTPNKLVVMAVMVSGFFSKFRKQLLLVLKLLGVFILRYRFSLGVCLQIYGLVWSQSILLVKRRRDWRLHAA